MVGCRCNHKTVVHAAKMMYLARDDEAQDALAFGVKVMSTSPDWWPDIPVAAEGEMGDRYS